VKKFIDEMRYRSSTRDSTDVRTLVERSRPGYKGVGDRYPRAGTTTLQDWVAMGRPSKGPSIARDMPGPGPEKMAYGRGDTTEFTWVGRDGRVHVMQKPPEMNPNTFFNPGYLQPEMERMEEFERRYSQTPNTGRTARNTGR
jgi:hypothetical protein